jgi:hypothetical protein
VSEIIENELDPKSLKNPILAIVRLASDDKVKRDHAGVSTPYYQVTIDPKEISPSGEFIYFGNTHGDQLTGWRPLTDVVVEETIGEYASLPPKVRPNVPNHMMVSRDEVGALRQIAMGSGLPANEALEMVQKIATSWLGQGNQIEIRPFKQIEAPR